MGTFMSVEVEVDTILDAMNEDSQFTFEMWTTLAERLNMGLMTDNACDVLCQDREVATRVANQMKSFSCNLLAGIEMRHGPKESA